ncbi:MAG: monovalent cation/H+ antiporter complex subunit F [Syntrophales bacterium]|nr:monovalent cation/H+ antiporter complex subunit F [Syntrophales bacterium]
MEDFFLAIALALGFLIFFSLYRAVFGPTVFDRIIGAGFIGTKTTAILVLIGFIYKRIDMFVDIALAYSILNFVGTLILSKYFLRKGAK